VKLRKDNRSGRTNVYFENEGDLWCAEIRILRNGRRIRRRRRSKDREDVERWLDEQEHLLGLRV